MTYYLMASCTADGTIIEIEDDAFRMNGMDQAISQMASYLRLGENLWSDGNGGFVRLVEYA